MSPVGASIFSPRASMWNRVDPGLLGAPFSIIFALDSSGSMNTGTRLADLKTSVTAVLEDLKPFVGNVVANVGVTVWADIGVTDHRLDADAADIDELITFVNGIVAGTGGTAGEFTQFHMAFEGAADFYEASSAPEASRIMFFVTDGVATGDSASTAVGLRDAIDDILVFGFNINLTDISDTELVDNTPEDGVPVIQDGDPGAMVLAMEDALGGAAAAPTSEILFTVEPDASAVFLPDAQSSIWTPDNELGAEISALVAPSNLGATQVGNSVSLSWEDNNSGDANEDGISVYRSQATIDPENLPAPLANLAADAISYSDETVEAGNTYFYRVSAHRGTDEAVSSEISIDVGVAVISTDFSEYTADQPPSDWERRWVTTGPGWLVRHDNGESYLEFVGTTNANEAARRSIVWTALPTVADAEVLFIFYGTVSSTSNNQSECNTVLRLQGEAGSETGLVHGYRWGSQTEVSFILADNMRQFLNGSSSGILETRTSRDLFTKYYCRVNVQGDRHRMSIWEVGTDEPADFMYDELSDVVSEPGECGINTFAHRAHRIYWFGFLEGGQSRIPLPE